VEVPTRKTLNNSNATEDLRKQALQNAALRRAQEQAMQVINQDGESPFLTRSLH
jgi:hypothetical protein